jgi:DNA-binding CsgD family transcriptional regulator
LKVHCTIGDVSAFSALPVAVRASDILMPEKKLSEREATCLQWAAAGKTSRETAIILGVSERTVNFHVQNACRKLCVRNRRAAVATALTCGLLTTFQIGETGH